MEKPLRVGIIGTAWVGSGHAAAYAQTPSVTVAGLWDRTCARAEALAEKLSLKDLKVYDRWEELIERGNLDAISITTPPTFRREPIVAAIERGLHVLVEKPFTIEWLKPVSWQSWPSVPMWSPRSPSIGATHQGGKPRGTLCKRARLGR